MMPAEQLALLLGLVFLVAVAYSSVGHGGASGYLAVLSFFGMAPAAMAPGALCLNLLVAGVSFLSYRRAGHFAWRLLWPFLAASAPAAFAGGWLEVSTRTYRGVLAAALVWAAWRLAWATPAQQEESLLRPPPLKVALPVGAGIGLVSGVIGVGGGIFLSPLMLLAKWADPKRTAAASAAFIWVNSLVALCGHLARKTVDWQALGWLVGAAFLGGILGSWLGARHFRGLWLRRILAAVLALAAVKLLV